MKLFSDQSTTADPQKIIVVAAFLQHSLFDAISQVLNSYPVPIRLAAIANLQELVAAIQTHPDLILVDPFTAGSADKENIWQVLRSRGSYIPLVVLLPADTRDYRDAALSMGANGVVVLEKAASDLLPTIEQLLARVNLVNGVANRIAQTAQISAPAGEAAQGGSPAELSLEKLSSRFVEQRAPHLPLDSQFQKNPTHPGQPVFLRSLLLSPFSQSLSTSVERVARTACALNCGLHYCGLRVTVRGNHVVKIDPADFPDPRYRRICMKGISYVQMAAHPDRLLHPLKRVGRRGAGHWEQVSWDQALDEIASRMQTLSQECGPESIMFFSYWGQLSALNGGNGVYLRLASLLGASATSPAKFGLDSAVPSGVEDTLGRGAGFLANDYEDLPNSRLILIWGANPLQSRMNWWPFFLEAKKVGARLVAIDPRFNATAAKCDEWIPIRPGTDLYLALAMLNLIVQNGWIDQNFILNRTAAPLLVREDNGLYLRESDVSTEGSSKNFLVWDQQAQKAARPEQAQSPAVTGRYSIAGIACRPSFAMLRDMLAPYTPELAASKTGIPVGSIFSLTKTYCLSKPARIYTLYGVDRWHHGATFGRLIALLAAFTGNLGISGGGAGVDGFSDSFFFPGDFATPGGREFHPVNPAQLPEQILSGKPNPIRAVFVAFSNWLNQWPDQNQLLSRVLPELDLLVVADHFMTETARQADYVLPAAMLFEREDMVRGPGPYIQYQPSILPPPGECRSDFEIAGELAQRLGYAEYFSKEPGEYLKDMLTAADESLQGLSYEALREEGILRRSVSPETWVVHRDRRFNTPTGRVEFYVERLIPYGRALPDYEPPIEADPEGEIIHRYPLVCLTEHSRYRVHSTFRSAPWLREIDREPWAVIHPETAVSRQIKNKDLVRIFNDRGYVVLRAQISQAVPPGTVYLSQGWQSEDFYAGHAQTLTHNLSNPANAFGPNSSFSDVLVEIARFEEQG